MCVSSDYYGSPDGSLLYDRELDSAFGILVQQQADAFFVDADLFLNSRANQIVALAARHRLPGSYPLREYVEAGGLMSYGASLANAFHWAGIYTGRILQGHHPSDLPVMQSTKFEFVINLKTAKTRDALPAGGATFRLAFDVRH